MLARLAGEKLNSALVKAFVNAITFFPLGSMVRTTRDEIAIVVGINPCDPLHPQLALVNASGDGPGNRIDCERARSHRRLRAPHRRDGAAAGERAGHDAVLRWLACLGPLARLAGIAQLSLQGC